MSEVITFEEFLSSKYELTLKEFNLLYSDVMKDAIRHMYDTRFNEDGLVTYVVIAIEEDEDNGDVIYVGKDKERAYSIRANNHNDMLTVEEWANGVFIGKSSW